MSAEQIQRQYSDGCWRNFADLVAMSFDADDEGAMFYLHHLCGYLEFYERELANLATSCTGEEPGTMTPPEQPGYADAGR